MELVKELLQVLILRVLECQRGRERGGSSVSNVSLGWAHFESARVWSTHITDLPAGVADERQNGGKRSKEGGLGAL